MTKKRRNPVDVEGLFREVVQKENPFAKYGKWAGTHIVDMPRSPFSAHGSSISFRCNGAARLRGIYDGEVCKGEGDIVMRDIPRTVDYVIMEAEKHGCTHVATHEHGKEFPEAHVHIDCKRLREKQVRGLMELVRWF